MSTNRIRLGGKLTAGLAILALTLTACGGSDGGPAGSDGGGGGTITLGFVPSWTDGLSMAYLWKNVLEDRGYDVEFAEISDAAPLYAGVAGGDVDVFPSAWSERTQADYMAKYQDDLEDLGTWYEGASLTLAVPSYTDIDSLEDLAGNADMFGGVITGIEPGAGLTRTTKESVMPGYGLADSYQLVESSTTAMLAELQAAIDKKQDIVVTLWHPFWAYSQFDVKDLADPQGALGKPEAIHLLARSGFTADFPEVADLMGSFSLTDEQYAELENMVVNEYGDGKHDEAVAAWLKNNPEIAGELKA